MSVKVAVLPLSCHTEVIACSIHDMERSSIPPSEAMACATICLSMVSSSSSNSRMVLNGLMLIPAFSVNSMNCPPSNLQVRSYERPTSIIHARPPVPTTELTISFKKNDLPEPEEATTAPL